MAEGPLADSYESGDRNPPRFDPQTHTAHLDEGSRSRSTRCGTASGGASCPTEIGGLGVPPTVQWAAGEMILGANAPVHVHGGPELRLGRLPQRHRAAEALGPAHGRPRLGRHDGAHRARRGLRRRRRPHQGRDNGDGTWSIEGVKRFITSAEHDLNENIMHLVLARPEGAPGRHQGPVAVPRPQVPLRPRDRRAGRAQRRLRHERRAQDGPQGLGHLRAHLRRARRPGHRLAARRRARRHRADVPGHRVRPDDGRHQGHRHALDRLPRALEYAKERVQGADLTRMPTRPPRASRSPTTRTCAAA